MSHMTLHNNLMKFPKLNLPITLPKIPLNPFKQLLRGGAEKKRRSMSKSGTPKTLPGSYPLGTRRKGVNGKMFQVDFEGTKLVWKRCIRGSC